MDATFLRSGERLDEIGFGNLRLIQKPEEFCYGVDAVILADFAAKSIKGRSGFNTSLDLGTGTGIVPIILNHKAQLKQIYAVEVQSGSFDRLCRNVELNRLENGIIPVNDDVLRLEERLTELRGCCDAVTSNPPYIVGGAGLLNGNEARRIARHETTADLEEFIRVASVLLRDKGEFFMVHRPGRLVDICEYCRKYRLEPKELRFVSPNTEAKANILLIRAVKYGNPELTLREPLYVYKEKNGHYSDEIMNIYERI